MDAQFRLHKYRPLAVSPSLFYSDATLNAALSACKQALCELLQAQSIVYCALEWTNVDQYLHINDSDLVGYVCTHVWEVQVKTFQIWQHQPHEVDEIAPISRTKLIRALFNTSQTGRGPRGGVLAAIVAE